MDNKDIRVKCYKCGDKFTSAEMRYDPVKPGTLACKGCLGREIKPTTANPVEQNVGNLKYYCVKCNFKFVRRKDIRVSTCPYCGLSNTLTTKTDVDSLLKSSGSEFQA